MRFAPHQRVRPPSTGAASRLLAAAVVVAGGCRADVDIGLRAGRDGSGTIEVAATLDKAAAATIGDPAKAIRLDDLRSAGWTIEPAAARADGTVRVVARRTFANPDQATATLTSLTGPDGPFSGLRLTRTRSLTSIDTRLTGVVDLSQGVSVFSDGVVTAKLGAPLGVDDAELSRQMGGIAPGSVVHLRLDGHLAGRPAKTLVLPLGRKTVVAIRSRVWRTNVIVPIALAVLSLAIVLLSGVLRTRRLAASRRFGARLNHPRDGGPR